MQAGGLARRDILGAALVLVVAGMASPLRADLREPLLVVTDATGRSMRFDRESLDALPQISFRTATLWTETPTAFAGPSLRRVLAEAGVTTGQVRLIALNDYSVDLEVEDLEDEAPIIATRRDGQMFDIRDNGPLWVIYPFDKDMAYRAEENYAASVWQLVKVTALAR